MEEESALERTTRQPLIPRPKFRTPSSFLRISRRIGQAATRPVAGVKTFIKREFAMPSAQQLLGTNGSTSNKNRRPDPADDDQPKSREDLHTIAERSHEVIAQATTVFPFVLFPDTVTLDRTKVTIYKKNFFWSEDVVSIRIEDVLNATAGTNLIFGSLNVSSRVMNSTDHYLIKFLWKNDALHLKHLIQGYVIAQHNNIQVTHLPKEELIATLQELGHDGRS